MSDSATDRIEGLLFLILAQTTDSGGLQAFWFVCAFLSLFSWIERRARDRVLRRKIRDEIKRGRSQVQLP